MAPIGLGIGSETFARSLELCGADNGYVADEERLRQLEPTACADAVADLARGTTAGVVVAPSTPWSNRVLAEAAARLNVPFFPNCSSIDFEQGVWLVGRPGDETPLPYPLADGSLVLLSLTESALVERARPTTVRSFEPKLRPRTEEVPLIDLRQPEDQSPLVDARTDEAAPTALDTNQPRSKIGRMTTVLCAVAVFMIALELTVISVALPRITDHFVGVSPALLGWILTSYNVGVAALLLVAGWAAERFGRKRLFLIGLVVFTAGSVASGLAPTIEALIAGRVVQSIGGAMLLPSSLALILHSVPRSEHKAAIGVWGATAGLAAAIGPTLGALLVEYSGWRAVFLINVPIALAALAVGSRALVETTEEEHRRIDLVSVVAGALSTGFGVYAISVLGDRGIGDTAGLSFAAASVVLALLFARRTVRHSDPLFPPRVARLRSYAVGQVGTGLFAITFASWLVLVPTFLVRVWGYSTLEAGFGLAPAPLIMALSARPAGVIAQRWGLRRVVVVGLVACALAVIYWLAMVGSTASYVVEFLPGALLFGIGLGTALPMLTAASLRDIGESDYAIAAAGNTTCRQVAMAIGIASAVAIVGNDVASVNAYKLSWAISGALAILTGFIVMIWYPPQAASGGEPVEEAMVGGSRG
jgi:EmrB/QacA subfamily drug resistance transporter